MKKIVTLILTIVLMSLFTSCISDIPTKEITPSQEATQTPTEQVYNLNESAVFKDLKFTATEIKESYGEEFFEPEQGNVYVGVKFDIENISDEEQTVSTLLLFEGYVDDVKTEYSIGAAMAFDDGTLDGSVAPGKKLVGWYALEVPENWSNIELHVQSAWLSNNVAKFVFSK